jgi:hypothetical protein
MERAMSDGSRGGRRGRTHGPDADPHRHAMKPAAPCCMLPIEREGSPFVGRDAGEIAGVGNLVRSHDRRSAAGFRRGRRRPRFQQPGRIGGVRRLCGAGADRPRHRHDRLLAQATSEKIRAAARHARIVKSGNMSLGVNLLGAGGAGGARALGPDDFDIESSGDAPQAQGRRAVRHGTAARRGCCERQGCGH